MSKIGIFVGTVYGNSLAVAETAQEILEQQGHEVVVFDEPTLSDWQLYNSGNEIALIVTSSTGQGIYLTPSLRYIVKSKMLSVINLIYVTE